MAPVRTRSVRLDAETEARIARILDHMRAADPYRDTNDTDTIRVLIRRGAADYEREHGLAPLVSEPTPATSKPRAKKGGKAKARKP